jgi:hypothetical protein
VIELVHSWQVEVYIRARARIEQGKVGWYPSGAKHGHKERRFVLTVTVVTFENLDGALRLES